MNVLLKRNDNLEVIQADHIEYKDNYTCTVNGKETYTKALVITKYMSIASIVDHDIVFTFIKVSNASAKEKIREAYLHDKVDLTDLELYKKQP